jgi:hypothetical protein
MSDEIIQEVWEAKNRLARKFKYDMDALAADLQRRQEQAGREVVNLARDRAKHTAESPR